MTPEQLNDQFGIPQRLRFETSNGGLTRAIVTTPQADAEIYLYGAQVTHFQPRDSKPVLWMSQKAAFTPGKPIRGGVPICFPWFGPKAGDSSAPMHGLARLTEWTVQSVSRTATSTDLTLSLELLDTYALTFTVSVAQSLGMSLTVRNITGQPVVFEEALHTYFAVGDIRQTTITGLENTRFFTLIPEARTLDQGNLPVAFSGETDRVYLDTQSTCVIHDPVWNRMIEVAKSGSHSTVVWNPWIAKAKAMPDFGDEEWPEMLCIETCNVKENAICLSPQESHTMRAGITLV